MTERDFIEAYTLYGQGLDIGSGDRPFKADNIKTVDINHPLADVPNMPFEELTFGKGQTVDFIIFSHSLRHMDSVVHALKHAFELLQVGGRLIILEKMDRDNTAKHYFNFDEMNGILRLMEKVYFVEQKGATNEGSYYFVARKKGKLNKGETNENIPVI
jgi:ubiquinone/menaquinone biosynthesis C-methylase UbiE